MGSPGTYPAPSSSVTVTTPCWLLALREVWTVNPAWLEPVIATCALWSCPYPFVNVTFRFTTVSIVRDRVMVKCAFCPSSTDVWSGVTLASGGGRSWVLASRTGDHGLRPPAFRALTRIS